MTFKNLNQFFPSKLTTTLFALTLGLGFSCGPQTLDAGDAGVVDQADVEVLDLDAGDTGGADAVAPPPPPPPPPGAECGNGRVEAPEVCDGDQLDGRGCRTLGFAGGTLQCKDTCTDYETQSCDPLTPTPIAAPGESLELPGRVSATSPTYERPQSNCSPSFSEGHSFEALAIINNEAVLRTVRVSAFFDNGGGYVHAYRAPFAALTPGTNCIAGDGEFLNAITLNPGETVVLVASTQESGNPAGVFNMTVTTVDEETSGAECGNNILEDGEACDGTDFGTQTCAGRGFVGGTLSCDSSCGIISENDCEEAPVNPTATPIAIQGQTISLTGDLTGPPLWDRPSVTCGAGDGAIDHPFRTHTIVNNTGSDQVVRVTATWTGDGYLHAFDTPFNALSPLTGCQQGNDDFEGLNGSQIADLPIAAGETIEIVASSFRANTDLGAYSISVLTQQAATCGNGVREFGEVCDGTDLNSATCFTEAHSGGVLACSADCGTFEERDCFDYPDSVNIAVPGSTIEISGSVDAGAPRWAPPGADCVANNGDFDHEYTVHRIRNDTGSPQTISVNAAWADGDGFLFVYRRFTFVPASPNASCLAGNDDAGGQDASLVEDITITAGQELVIVATGFRPGPVGAYTLTVTTQQGAVCGNDTIEGNETCDGTDFATTCSAQGRSGGILGCNDTCALVTDNCFDVQGPQDIAQQGSSITIQGSIDTSDPRWDRIGATCLGTGVADHHFDVTEIRNNTGGEQILDIEATWTQNGADGYLHVYSNFDSATPLTGCLEGDDDFEGQSGSRITGIVMAPGESRFVVASTFAGNIALGGYTINIESNGPEATEIAPKGGTIQFSGSLDTSDPVWRRMNANCTTRTGTPANHFDVYRIINKTGARQDLTIRGNWAVDGYIHLVGDGFDTLNPDPSLCITGNDDFRGALSSRIVSDPAGDGDSIFLNNDETALIIVSAFNDNTAIGEYTLDVTTGSEDEEFNAAAMPAEDQSFESAGTLHSTDLTWNRRNEDCSLATNEDRPFDVHFFENTTADSVNFRVVAEFEGDGFIHVYDATVGFDLDNPDEGRTTDGYPCLVGDDDTNALTRSEVADFALAGDTIAVIVSARGTTPLGAYTLDFRVVP